MPFKSCGADSKSGGLVEYTARLAPTPEDLKRRFGYQDLRTLIEFSIKRSVLPGFSTKMYATGQKKYYFVSNSTLLHKNFTFV